MALNDGLIHATCDNLADILEELKHNPITPTKELVDALERLDLYIMDEAKAIQYYYRKAIASNPEYREMLNTYYLDTMGKPYEEDFTSQVVDGVLAIKMKK